MKKPGFTAEASLYRTSNHYIMAGGDGRVGGVVPQQFGPPGAPGGERVGWVRQSA
jgi:hypothetical protein